MAPLMFDVYALSIFLLVTFSLLLCDAEQEDSHSQRELQEGESFGSIYTLQYSLFADDCPPLAQETFQLSCGEGGTIRSLDDYQGMGTSFCVPINSGKGLECVGNYITIMCVGTTVEHWQATVTRPGFEYSPCRDGPGHTLLLQPVCRNLLGSAAISVPQENVICDENSTLEDGICLVLFCQLIGVCQNNQMPDFSFTVTGVSSFGDDCLWDPAFETVTDVDTTTVLVENEQDNQQNTVRVLHFVRFELTQNEFCRLQTPSLLTLACGEGARIDLVGFEKDVTESGCERQGTNVLQCEVDTSSVETTVGFALEVSCQGNTLEELAIQADFVSEKINCRPDTSGISGNPVGFTLDVLQHCVDAALYPNLPLLSAPYDKAPDWYAQECWPFQSSTPGEIPVDIFYDPNNNTELIYRPIKGCAKFAFNCFNERLSTFFCDVDGSQPSGPLRVFIRAENIVLGTECYLPLVADDGSTATSSSSLPAATTAPLPTVSPSQQRGPPPTRQPQLVLTPMPAAKALTQMPTGSPMTFSAPTTALPQMPTDSRAETQMPTDPGIPVEGSEAPTAASSGPRAGVFFSFLLLLYVGCF